MERTEPARACATYGAEWKCSREAVFALEADTLLTNVTYRVEGFDRPYDAPQQVTDKVAEIAWANSGLWLKRDSTFAVGKHTVHFLASDEPSVTAVVPQWRGRPEGGASGAHVSRPKVGTPAHHRHPTELRLQRCQLGWANIDAPAERQAHPSSGYHHPHRQCGRQGRNLRITLVMKSHNLYIPGYRKKDGTYAFSHSDQERCCLPIGAKAVVVATAGTGIGTVFAMQPIEVQREGRIDLHLTPTTESELKQALLAAL
ncbi:MAG: hypothetical protein R2818_04820 [Flavobacteriales bacterium]